MTDENPHTPGLGLRERERWRRWAMELELAACAAVYRGIHLQAGLAVWRLGTRLVPPSAAGTSPVYKVAELRTRSVPCTEDPLQEPKSR